MYKLRKAANITLSVWKALFLREALSRLFSQRAVWFWLLAEPIFHVTYIMFIFTVIRVSKIGGFDTSVWIMVGMLGFLMFRRTGTQVMGAIGANQALFAYRQVKPVDTTLVRGFLEGYLMVVVTAILLAFSALFGFSVIPQDPLLVLGAFFGLWALGLGYGLVTSVVTELIPEFNRIIQLVMMPIYIISGVMFPLSAVPPNYREWLMLNPVAHGLEVIRLGYFINYHAVPEANIEYVFGFALVSIFLGLSLHRRFALRLVTL